MPQGKTPGRLAFVRSQLDLTRRYAAAIERGDFRSAKSFGLQLARGGSELAAAMKEARQRRDSPESAEIRAATAEIAATQASLLESLEPARNRLSDLLREIRKGRQLLAGYRSGRAAHTKLFEMTA